MRHMNDRPMRNLGLSRRELFETIERDALVALPADDWEFAEWRRARVNLDYGETAGPLTLDPNPERRGEGCRRNARDRRGAGAASGAGANRRGHGRSDAAAGSLWQRADRGARLRRAGNDGSLRASPPVGVQRTGRARAPGDQLRTIGRELLARRSGVDARAHSADCLADMASCADLPEAGAAHRVEGLPTPRPRKKPSGPPSRSQRGKPRAASNCSPRFL